MTDKNDPTSSEEYLSTSEDRMNETPLPFSDVVSEEGKAEGNEECGDTSQPSEAETEQSGSSETSVGAVSESIGNSLNSQLPTDTGSSDGRESEQLAPAKESNDSQPSEVREEQEGAGGSAVDKVAEESLSNRDTALDGPSDEQRLAAESEKPTKKKKRRKKKKQAVSSVETSESVEEEGSKKARRRESQQSPFTRFITAAVGGKKHVFAINEVVAGRVIRCEEGAVVIDLFGKAIAVTDEFEPREIPSITSNELTRPSDPSDGDDSVTAEAKLLNSSDSYMSESVSTPSEKIASNEPIHNESNEPSAHLTESQESDSSYSETDDNRSADAGLIEAPEPSKEEQQKAEKEHAESNFDENSSLVNHEVGGIDGADLGNADFDDMSAKCEEKHVDDASQDEMIVELPPPEPPEVGQIFKGRIGAVAESGHVALINRVIDIGAVRKKIEVLREQRKRVQGLVFGFNRGGFDVIVEGIRAFCPASGMSLAPIENPKDFICKKIDFTLPVSKGSSKDLIISRRSILEKEHRRKIKDLLRSLKPGQKHKGKVTQIRDYGLFVDIGGVEGLVHQSEISYAFGVKPSEVAKVGDELDVQIIKVTYPSDQKKESKKDRTTRVDLSIKALLPDPWDIHADVVSEGSVQKGKVTRTTEFGAFVELAPSIEGLLHISELGKELTHANQVVKEDEDIYVVIERADRKTRRISLSKLSASAVKEYKEGKLVEPGERPRSLQPGARVKVRVDSFEHHGLNVRVIGAAGKRGRGYIPNSETGTERGTDLRKRFPVSTELEVKIISIERDGGLKCSIKAIAIDDERKAVKEYRREAAKQGFGTFGDLLRAKLGEVSGD